MRIGYVCKYVPTEALEAMGAHMERIEPDARLVSFDAAESCMHANVCSFAKATFETVLSGNLDGIVLTTCCDSMRRLADALRAQAPNLFIHVLDVPRDTGEAACALYQRRVAELLSAYGMFANATFSEKKLFAQLGGTLCPAEGTCDSTLELDYARFHSEAVRPSFRLAKSSSVSQSFANSNQAAKAAKLLSAMRTRPSPPRGSTTPCNRRRTSLLRCPTSASQAHARTPKSSESSKRVA